MAVKYNDYHDKTLQTLQLKLQEQTMHLKQKHKRTIDTMKKLAFVRIAFLKREKVRSKCF